MRKIIKLSISVLLLSTLLDAGALKGEKIYSKKLKKDCGFINNQFSSKHTREEWSKIYKDGKMADEIKLLCPKSTKYKSEYDSDMYAFVSQYASDTGNVPSR